MKRRLLIVILLMVTACGTDKIKLAPQANLNITFVDYFKNYKARYRTAYDFRATDEYLKKYYPNCLDNLRAKFAIRQALSDVELFGSYPVVVTNSPYYEIAFDRQGFIEITQLALDNLDDYELRLVLRHEIAHVCTSVFNYSSMHEQELMADLFACFNDSDDTIYILALQKLKASKKDLESHPGWPKRMQFLRDNKFRLSSLNNRTVVLK